MRENRPLKVKVCVILTLITLGILAMFLVFLPSLFISDAISFVASGSSIFFPNVPDTHFLWFLPEQFHNLPLSLGQFLDVCVLLLILLQAASTLYIVLARFYRYQPSSADIPIEVKRKFGDALPNFMRWNILPHGHQIFGETPVNDKIGKNRFTTNYRGFQGSSSEELVCLSAKRNDGLHRPNSMLSLITNRSLISGHILGFRPHLLLDCNILVSRSDRYVPAPYGCRVRNSPRILGNSCFLRFCNSTQKMEVFA